MASLAPSACGNVATGDVGKWLEGLGLGEYAEVFAEIKIDFDVPKDLSEEDLTVLEVTALGARKRLL